MVSWPQNVPVCTLYEVGLNGNEQGIAPSAWGVLSDARVSPGQRLNALLTGFRGGVVLASDCARVTLAFRHYTRACCR